VASDPQVLRRLEELYGDVDELEWYVGIFAEDHLDDGMMGKLLKTRAAGPRHPDRRLPRG
jgi:prostaglandin-endoperoxide synthase 2